MKETPHCKACGHEFASSEDGGRATHKGVIRNCLHCDVCSSGADQMAPDRLSGEELNREILRSMRRIEYMLAEKKHPQR